MFERRAQWRFRLPRLPPAARRRPVLLLSAAVVLVACCCAGLFVTGILGVVSSTSVPSLGDCLVQWAAGDPEAAATLDEEQQANAATIVQVGRDLPAPPRAWVIAVATAMQESGLRNLDYGDRDSLGLFQQRPSQGWGTPAQLLDPGYAANAFYERLLQVDGWETMPLTQAAQAVQRSAFPDAYARHEPLAVAVVSAAAGDAAGDLACLAGQVSLAGWARPVPGQYSGGFRSAARPDHYGIDTTDGRGTVIRAAADGTVAVATCQAVAGGQPYSCDVDGSPQVGGCGWYVDILHAGGVVTRYCHLLSRPDVSVGEQVSAGQPIGQVGSSGHSSGPHLHFEVELRTVLASDETGVTIERRQTDPVPFLAERGIVFECVSTPTNCDPVHGDRVRVEHRSTA